ncbi:MAG: family 78 glycoside hydrolase catalytic domain [Caldilineaceae bacterium]
MTAYPVIKMPTRRAEWIWRQRPAPPPGMAAIFGPPRSVADEQNRFVYFRKTFSLNGQAQSAPLHISADGRYQLFVNGRFIGRGPARCDPAFQYYDSYAIAEHLHEGQNVIAVLAHSYGRHMSWYQLPRLEHAQLFGCAGIFVQCDIQTGGGALTIDSDTSWRYLESTAWQQNTSAGAVGFVEIYDARLAPVDWQALDFADANWPIAQILIAQGWPRTPATRPFPFMTPRDIPPLLERVQRAVRLHRCGQVTEVHDQPNLPLQIGAEALHDLTTCRVAGLDKLVNGGAVMVQTMPGQAVALVLDFGGTVTGRPTFVIDAPEGAIIDIGTSERLQEDHIEPRVHSFLTSENVDRVITRAGRQQWERFEWTGFRYLQLTIRNAPTPLTIRDIALNFTSYPVERRGSFACSDELLNQIWQAGANTLQLCMHDGFVDCPQREQRQFVGDAYVEALVNFVAFGDTYLTAKLLRQVQQSQRADGMTQTATPSDTAAESSGVICDYALYWLMTIREYVRYTGDAALVTELYPGVERVLAWFERFVDADGLINSPPHWIFVDWAEVDKRGEATALNAQFVQTLRISAELAEIIGLPARATLWRARADQITAAINQHLWDETRSVYVDARVDRVQSQRVSQQANGLCLAYGIAPGDRQARVIAYITDPDRVKLTASIPNVEKVPAFDEAHDVVLAQPFCAHHLHRGLVRAGRSNLFLANLRQRWGAMMAAGSTTIWELWNPNVSQCHAWSTTPTFDLSTYVLGVTPLADGFQRVQIAPQPVDLTWAQGTVPTPQGAIDVHWQQTEQNFQLTVTAPAACALQINLPYAVSRIDINGQVAWQVGQTGRSVDGLRPLANADGQVELVSEAGGRYTIQVVKK